MGILEYIFHALSGKDEASTAAERKDISGVVLPLEGHDLDEQQLACIASDAHTQLVLAGAGAGKTTTIVGLVKYLLGTGQYQSRDILALSYTHASARELSERGIKEAPVSSEVIWGALGRDKDEALESVASLFTTLISLMKSTGTTPFELKVRCSNKRTRFTLSLLTPVYEAYQSMLASSDNYPDAEERRLFYVALTRARKKVFLLTVEGKESRFVEELRQRWGDQLKKGRFVCPLCGGELLVVHGKYGRFWGCRNYRTIGCKFTRNIPTKEKHPDR